MLLINRVALVLGLGDDEVTLFTIEDFAFTANLDPGTGLAYAKKIAPTQEITVLDMGDQHPQVKVIQNGL
jgi:hypothetical protein